MIGVSPDLAPSALLHDRDISPFIQTLFRQSRASRLNYEWDQAIHFALEALELCQEQQSRVALALTKLHLVDFYCEVGEIGYAIQQGKEAYHILHRQPDRAQRHNESVAAYCLGLLQELLLFGDVLTVLRWYQKALEQFKAAQEYWATRNEKRQIEICTRTYKWIQERSNQAVERHTAAQSSWQVVFDVWQPSSASVPFLQKYHLQGYIVDDEHVLIDGETYVIHSGSLPNVIDQETRYHFALSVREQEHISMFPKAQIGDYLFIRQQWQIDEEKIGVIWEPGSGWAGVDFERSSDGTIYFTPRSSKIIGDPAGKLKGYVTALLKPTSAQQQPSPPPSHTPPLLPRPQSNPASATTNSSAWSAATGPPPTG